MADAAAAPAATSSMMFTGPTLIGAFLVYFLFGVFMLQTLKYLGNAPASTVWWHYPHVLVAVMFVLELLGVVFITVAIWDMLIINGASTAPWIPPPVAPGTGVLNGLVGWIVQLFFAMKVWRLASNVWEKGLAALIGITANAGLAGALGTASLFAIQGREYSEKMDVPAALWLCAAVICDLLITGSMVMMLSKYKKRTSFTATKQLLRMLTRNTIENGLVTSVSALVNVILYFTRRNQDNLHLIFQYATGRLYAIVLLTSLLRAQHSSSAHNTQRSGTTSGSGGPAGPPGGIPLSTHRTGHWAGAAPGAQLQITVHYTVHDDAAASEYGSDHKGATIGWEDQAAREKGAHDAHDIHKTHAV